MKLICCAVAEGDHINICVHSVGQSWEDKVKFVRAKLQGKNAHCVVVSALDEVACEYR